MITDKYKFENVENSELIERHQSTILVSIIVPVYEVENYILRAIYSLIRQTYDHIEIIIVNDATQDHSIDLINTIKDPRIKIINHDKNKGLSQSRNDGIYTAQGEYIAFLDSDDYLDLNFIEELLKVAIDTGADVVMASTNIIKDGYIKTIKPNRSILSSYLEKVQAMPNGASWNKLYRAKLIKDHNIYFPPDLYWEDNFFTIKIAYHSNFIVCTNATSYNYCLRENSITTNFDKQFKLKRDSLIIAKKILEFNKDKIFTADGKNILYKFMASNFVKKSYFKDLSYLNDAYELFSNYDYKNIQKIKKTEVLIVLLKFLFYYMLMFFPNETLRYKVSKKYSQCKANIKFLRSRF